MVGELLDPEIDARTLVRYCFSIKWNSQTTFTITTFGIDDEESLGATSVVIVDTNPLSIRTVSEIVTLPTIPRGTANERYELKLSYSTLDSRDDRVSVLVEYSILNNTVGFVEFNRLQNPEKRSQHDFEKSPYAP